MLLTLRYHCDSAEHQLYLAVAEQYGKEFPLPGGCVPRSRAYTLARTLSSMEQMGLELREDYPNGEGWRVVYATGDDDQDPVVVESLCQVSAHTLAFAEARNRAQRLVTLSS